MEFRDKLCSAVTRWASERAAVVAGFEGSALRSILRDLGMAPATESELPAGGIYRPVSRNHPER